MKHSVKTRTVEHDAIVDLTRRRTLQLQNTCWPNKVMLCVLKKQQVYPQHCTTWHGYTRRRSRYRNIWITWIGKKETQRLNTDWYSALQQSCIAAADLKKAMWLVSAVFLHGTRPLPASASSNSVNPVHIQQSHPGSSGGQFFITLRQAITIMMAVTCTRQCEVLIPHVPKGWERNRAIAWHGKKYIIEGYDIASTILVLWLRSKTRTYWILNTDKQGSQITIKD